MSETRAVSEKLGHPFRKEALLIEALTHSSLVNEPKGKGRKSNSRLAHLGDAVVELAVRSALYRKFPDANKGALTSAKKDMVSNVALAKVAKEIGIAQRLERGQSRPVAADNTKVLAEVFEATMGAVFLDSDFETAAAVVARHVAMPSTL